MQGNVVVGQSGGPTAVINSSVAGVYTAAKKLGIKKVYGMVHGVQGFLKENLCDLDEYLDNETGIELLKRTPAAFLGSCRFKLPEMEGNEDVYEKIFSIMEKYEIEFFLYCGGNDSMDTIKMLSDYAEVHHKKQKFVGIPKTIDNDLPITDHCPGYGSAAKYIATTVKEIVRDNSAFGVERPTICVVEIMGRNAGWLTAAAALAKDVDCVGCDAIYLPEKVFDMDRFLEDVRKIRKKKASIVIAVSEGVKTADGKFVCEFEKEVAVDAFGHKQMSGTGVILAEKIKEEMHITTRAIEFSTLQRAANHIASLTDINEAFLAGKSALKMAAEGKSGVMITLVRTKEDPYSCETGCYDIHAIANEERKVPFEWISEDGMGLTEEFEEYARPLIMGELQPLWINGTPRHLVLKQK